MICINSVLDWLADLTRILVRCVFPLASVAVFLLLLVSDQGGDVLRIEAVTTDRLFGMSGITLLLLATTVLATSVWYCLRWLLAAEMAALPLDMMRTVRLRTWLPRFVGAAAFVSVTYAVRNLADLPHVGSVFAGAGLVFLALTALRGRLLSRMDLVHARDSGRAGAPAVLPRDHSLPPMTLRLVLASLAFSFLLALSFLLWPVAAPRKFGALALVPLALASINIFGSFVLTYWPLRNGLPGLVPMVLLVAAVFGAWNDNHQVRFRSWTPGNLPADRRMSVSDRFDQWHGASQDGSYVVVATEGGGIRAALWTATLLQELDKIPGFRQRLFAISGVSGGSLGAAAYLSQRYAEMEGGRPCSASDDLKRDFLSPPLAGMLYADLMQRFLPYPMTLFDRARNLELSWEQAFEDCAGQPMAQTLTSIYSQHPQLPVVLLNTTVVELGKRAVLGDVKPTDFNDVVDLVDPHFSSSAQPLAGLAHDSARFPAVSPAGTVLEARNCGNPDAACARYRVVDGGYFDDSGASTAAELIRAVQVGHARGQPALHPVLLIVRNDFFAQPICDAPAGSGLCRSIVSAGGAEAAGSGHPGRFAPEITSPLLGLFNARGAHGRLAAIAAAQAVEQIDHGAVFELALQLPSASATQPVVMPPLGWELSSSSQETIQRQAAALVATRRDELAGALH